VPMTWGRGALALGGVAAIAGTLTVLADRPVTTVAVGWGLRWALPGAVALALVAAGSTSASWAEAWLLTVMGAVVLLPELEGLRGAPAWLTTVAASATPALLALVLVLVLSRAARYRYLAAGAVTAAGAAVLTRLFLVDPFTGTWCWRSCVPNPWAVTGSWGAVEVALVALAGTVGVASICVGRLRTDSSFGQIGFVTLVVALAAPVATRQAWPTGPTASALAAWAAVQVGAALLAVDVAAPTVRRQVASFRLTRLAGRLTRSPGPEELGGVIGRAVGDPALRIRYWDRGHGRFLDPTGRPVTTDVGEGRRTTLVTRGGALVAAVDHASFVDGASLDRALGPALRLVLENAGLRSTTLAELADARATRAQVVASGSAERRRLERDLHDGAQQRVVALALLTRMLADVADAPAELAAQRAVASARAVLEDLRRVARGLYPAILSDSGLAGALEDLADSSQDVVVDLSYSPLGHMGPVHQETAYHVCAAALADARRRRATVLRVEAERCDDRLLLTMEDDGGPPDPSTTRGPADQVSALSGSLVADQVVRGSRLGLELPCGS
jgi:signal transduction histidine kinase